MNDIAKRFQRDTADHEMTVLHDDGLYRHLLFHRVVRKPGEKLSRTDLYWFELITAPGSLIFQGDGESFVFRRLEDMFAFFRDSAWNGAPNIDYWAEKLTDGCDRVVVYQQEMLVQQVKEAVGEAKLDGLLAAVQEEVLDQLLDDSNWDRKLVDDFRFYVNGDDKYDYRKSPDFEFWCPLEWNCTGYHWWFLWACHAIVWGIAKYDAYRADKAEIAREVRDDRTRDAAGLE
ncbi:hypothetical protein [Kibdelosporangium phytohabitans]|uniref:Uncharacterized protein n=1 Tax=Kibdelosporangium phytohabitans TaxID=860235 RepID=A0A0N9HV71_9PSEU|nr:hypothetical protein [Kibdelosporangium phytohabitans]ALG06822.1 hypothetical protein AOZ06_07670 [Kibdelosporangium phytohabitans]MBE1468065.1 hypothetical protein [Kibdelosporangium phytohabitans]